MKILFSIFAIGALTAVLVSCSGIPTDSFSEKPSKAARFAGGGT